VRRESVTTSSAPSSRAGLRRRSVHAVTRRSNIPRFGNPTPRLNPEADAQKIRFASVARSSSDCQRPGIRRHAAT
jgi:hypothetical protein